MLNRTSFKVVDATHPEQDNDERCYWDSCLIFHRLPPVVVMQVEHLRADAQFLLRQH